MNLPRTVDCSDGVVTTVAVAVTAVSTTASVSSMLTSSPVYEDRDEDCCDVLRGVSSVAGSERSSGGGGGGGGGHAPGSEMALFSALLLGEEWLTGSEFLWLTRCLVFSGSSSELPRSEGDALDTPDSANNRHHVQLHLYTLYLYMYIVYTYVLYKDIILFFIRLTVFRRNVGQAPLT